MKVAVFTDSLGLPRLLPEPLDYKNTWVNILGDKVELFRVSIGGGTIVDLYSQMHYVQAFNPDLVFVQSGIVDCAPRALSKTEAYILNKYKLSKKLLKVILTPKRTLYLRKVRKCNYTPLDLFVKTATKIQDALGKQKVFFIGIIPPSDSYENKVPGIKMNVLKYNSSLEGVCKERFINLDSFNHNDIMSDQIHLSEEGNKKLFEMIFQVVCSFQDKNSEEKSK